LNITVRPFCAKGEIISPPSKSGSHRALVASALSDGRTLVKNLLSSDDITATAGALSALGARVETGERSAVVYPGGRGDRIARINCNESGTTARFILPLSAYLATETVITGRGRLPERPFAPLCSAMRSRGTELSSDFLPITVKGGLHSGVYEIEGSVSSQYISALLLVLPLLEGDSEIRLLSPLASAPYVNMTLDTMKHFGVSVTQNEKGFYIPGGQRYLSPGEIWVEGDWSSASALLAAGFMSERGITVKGLDSESFQGDKKIAELLSLWGGEVSYGDNVLKISKGKILEGDAVYDASHTPDLVPAVAVAAAARVGRTEIVGAARLREKESDRLETVAAMLNALGGEVSVNPDGMIINGKGRLRGGVADGAGDHRIVMCAAVAASISDGPVKILGAEAVSKSYPEFWQDITALGAEITEE